MAYVIKTTLQNDPLLAAKSVRGARVAGDGEIQMIAPIADRSAYKIATEVMVSRF